MDVDGRDFDPGEDAAYFIQKSKQFQGFARSIQKGDYSFDPLTAINEIRDRLEKFTPLLVVRQIADMCADLPALEVRVVKGKKTAVRVRKAELFAHWQLAHFQGTIDEDKLLEDAERISKAELDTLAKKFLRAQEKKTEAEARVQEFPDWTTERQKAHRASIRALDAFQKARAELLDLIGAGGESFDPDPEVPYVTQWRNILLQHHASLGINYGRDGVKPNAEELKKRRLEKGWKQTDLVTAVLEATETDINIRTIRRMEAGNRVNAKTLLTIAKTFQVNVRTLIHNENERGAA